jgi:hypothetical protein
MDEEKLTPVRLVIAVLLYLAALFILALLVFRLVVFRPDGPASTVDRPNGSRAPTRTTCAQGMTKTADRGILSGKLDRRPALPARGAAASARPRRLGRVVQDTQG